MGAGLDAPSSKRLSMLQLQGEMQRAMDFNHWAVALNIGLDLLSEYDCSEDDYLRRQIAQCYEQLGLPELAEKFIFACDYWRS